MINKNTVPSFYLFIYFYLDCSTFTGISFTLSGIAKKIQKNAGLDFFTTLVHMLLSFCLIKTLMVFVALEKRTCSLLQQIIFNKQSVFTKYWTFYQHLVCSSLKKIINGMLDIYVIMTDRADIWSDYAQIYW